MNDINTLKIIMSYIGPNSCPNDINLHCHTTCSDGSLTPIELIKQATINGLKHIAVTDHHSIDAYKEIVNWLNENNSTYNLLPTLWSGIEISCLLNKCLVHVVGLGFDLYHSSINPYTKGEAQTGNTLQACKVVSSIHKAGGIAILAHPARYRIPYDEMINEAKKQGFDGAEAWYDYDFSYPWRPSELICFSIDKQLKSLNLLSSCGTDTHGMDITAR